MNHLFIIVIVILVISTIVGMARGLVKTFFGLFGVAVLLVIASLLTPRFAAGVKENTGIYDNIRTGIEEHIEKSTGIDKKLVPAVYEAGSKVLADKAVNAGSFAFVFIVLYIVKWFLLHFLGIIARLPVLSGLNRIGGGIGGFAGGLVVVWMLFLVITFTASSQISRKAFAEIDESPVLTEMYDRAPVVGSRPFLVTHFQL